MRVVIDGRILYEGQEKQNVFHDLIKNRAVNGKNKFLYGGAAGGGKSFALRWQGHKECLTLAGIRVLLVRGSFPELERTHLSKIPFEMPDRVAKWNEQKKRLTYFNGSVFEFGYGEHKRDFKQYLSAEYDIILIDELTTIPFEFVILLMSRLRTTKLGFIPYFASASNPGEQAHVHVKSYFVDKDFGAEFPDMTSIFRPEEIAFIPATVYDNIKLMQADPNYVTRLQQLSPTDRKRFLEGSWEIFEGQFFEKLSREVHEIEPFDVPLEWEVIGGMDYGTVSTSYLGARDFKGNAYLIGEWTEIGESTTPKAKSYRAFLKYAAENFFSGRKKWEDIVTYSDVNMFAYQKELDEKIAPADTFRTHGISLKMVSKAGDPDEGVKFRRMCNDHFKNLIYWKKAEKSNLWIQKPKLYVMKGRCPEFWKSVPLLQADPKNDRDILKTLPKKDHWYDAAKHLLINLRAPKDMRDEQRIMERIIRQKKAAVGV